MIANKLGTAFPLVPVLYISGSRVAEDTLLFLFFLNMLKRKLIFFMAFIFTGCTSYSPPAPVIEDVNFPDLKGVPATQSKIPVTNFSSQLKSNALNLDKDEISLLKTYTETKPVGTWATSDNLTSKKTLENNFQNLRHTFGLNGPVTEKEYMVKAIAFATSNNFYAKFYFDSQYFQKKHKILVIKWDAQTKEFIIIHINGRISNYQLTESIGLPRYISIPENL